MTDRQEQQVDVRLRWEDEGRRRDQSADSVSVGDVDDEDAVAEEVDEDAQEIEPDDDGDEFQWDADREQALLDALEETVEGTTPLVQRHIESVMMGLKAETMSAEEARHALSEIDEYLSENLDWEQSKPPVDHEDFMQSRKDKVNALCAWRESVNALREYLDKGEEVQLKVASYAAEQGKSFLEQSLDLLMACEPQEVKWDEEEEEDEDWDSEEPQG